MFELLIQGGGALGCQLIDLLTKAAFFGFFSWRCLLLFYIKKGSRGGGRLPFRQGLGLRLRLWLHLHLWLWLRLRQWLWLWL
ncbi:hypothetical protein F0L74_16235 [Chitinophaga agrisoli]|uniref:Uncharacterized protein n=1 Tax=Chitinophaga agrisoli TaxID=2607653 RepID=A0A5B2VT92_9BACT|nr:hypothetical protein F0L74_16235 [Chitinophaga agrisoli]